MLKTLQQYNGYKQLTPDDKKRIVQQAAKGERRSQELLILAYDGFARSEAVRFAYRRRHVVGELDMEELVQECRCALLEAAKTWDPDRGAFTTIARYYMLNAMEREPNSGQSAIDVPINAHKKERTANFVKRARAITSLDAPLGEDGDRTLADTLADDEDSADKLFDDAIQTERLRALVAQLSPREQSIVDAYFYNEQTFEEIAQTFGCTRARIGQIMESIVAKLRKRIALDVRP